MRAHGAKYRTRVWRGRLGGTYDGAPPFTASRRKLLLGPDCSGSCYSPSDAFWKFSSYVLLPGQLSFMTARVWPTAVFDCHALFARKSSFITNKFWSKHKLRRSPVALSVSLATRPKSRGSLPTRTKPTGLSGIGAARASIQTLELEQSSGMACSAQMELELKRYRHSAFA